MKKHITSYSQKIRHLRSLSKKVNALIEKGEFKLLDASKQQQLTQRLQQLYFQLGRVLSHRKMRKILAGAAMIIGMGMGSANLQAQSFAEAQIDPFGIDFTDAIEVPVFADIDNDGDLDLFTASYYFPEGSDIGAVKVRFYENTGTPSEPNFGEPIDHPFGLQDENFNNEYLKMFDFADMDNDGDLDVIMGGYEENYEVGRLEYFENIGTEEEPNFAAPVVSPFGLGDHVYNALPNLVDIDDDGDQDLFVSEYPGITQFYENVGTPEEAAFASPVEDPFGIMPIEEGYLFFDVADIDGDGDQDILATPFINYNTQVQYMENTGTAMEPQFAAPSIDPFNFNLGSGIISFVGMGDVDADGDSDILFESVNILGSEQTVYFENLSVINSTNSLAEKATLKLFPNPVSDNLNLQIEFEAFVQVVQLELLDATGRVLENQVANLNSNHFQYTSDVQNLAAGVYFLKINADKEVGVLRFVKE